MNRARCLVGALVCGAAVCTLVACGSSSEAHAFWHGRTDG